MHSKGFIHCDLKTANILVDFSKSLNRPVALITDFGMTKSVIADFNPVKALKKVNIPGGTIVYAAPEQILSLNLSLDITKSGELAKAVDIYAFSLIIFEMINDKNPWN